MMVDGCWLDRFFLLLVDRKIPHKRKHEKILNTRTLVLEVLLTIILQVKYL